MEITSHIDYLTITTPIIHWLDPNENFPIGERAVPAMMNMLYRYPSNVVELRKRSYPRWAGGMGYTWSYPVEYLAARLWAGARHGKMTLQLPGEACHLLRVEGQADGDEIGLTALLTEPAHHFTRLDLAIDLHAEVHPRTVMSWFSEVKEDDCRYIPSVTGITMEYGAPKSECYFRVYRLAAPHPRSNSTRIEFELKGAHAVQAADVIGRDGLLPVAKGLLLKYGMDNPLMFSDTMQHIEQQKLHYKKRQSAGSLMWFYKQCLPAVRKRIRDGTITVDELLKIVTVPEDE